MEDASARLEAVRTRIREACAACGRRPEDVELIAVSKTFPADAIREIHQAGQTVFGESRQQEAAPKIAMLPGGLKWHFIGSVQRNKVRKLLPLFDVIHAVDSLRLAAHIDEVAAELGLFPRVFLQVNLSGEETKGGYAPEMLERDLPAL